MESRKFTKVNNDVIANKPYECEKCGKIFNKKGNLNRHLRVHKSAVKNVICNICSKSFANSANLKKHFENSHIGLKMEPPKLALVPNKGIYIFQQIYYLHNSALEFICTAQSTLIC